MLLSTRLPTAAVSAPRHRPPLAHLTGLGADWLLSTRIASSASYGGGAMGSYLSGS